MFSLPLNIYAKWHPEMLQPYLHTSLRVYPLAEKKAVGKAGTAVRRSHHCSYTFHSDLMPAMTFSFRGRETNCCWEWNARFYLFIFFRTNTNVSSYTWVVGDTCTYITHLTSLKTEFVFHNLLHTLFRIIFSVSEALKRHLFCHTNVFLYMVDIFKSNISIRTCSQGWNYVLLSFWDSIKWD